MTSTDLLVVGAGIVGLAHAADAHARGLRVTVVDRDERAVGASLRNFGHICTTAQDGVALDYARAARERWIALGAKAGFEVKTCGTVVVARSAAERAALVEFAGARDQGEVELLDRAGVLDLCPPAGGDVLGGAFLPLDLRVSPIDAVPALAAWLESEGVTFRWGTHVNAISPGSPGVVHTSRGDLTASYVVHAVNHDVDRLFPDIAAASGVRRCRLQMFEVEAPGGVRIEPGVLTGTGILRYGGLAAQPSAAAVRAELERDHPELLEIGLNLMLTQRPDGAIVLGDSHHYDRTLQPFDDEDVADLVLREGARLLGSPLRVRRRWRGVYAHSPSTDYLVAAPHPGLRVVAVTSGIGMTTALGLAPAVLDALL